MDRKPPTYMIVVREQRSPPACYLTAGHNSVESLLRPLQVCGRELRERERWDHHVASSCFGTSEELFDLVLGHGQYEVTHVPMAGTIGPTQSISLSASKGLLPEGPIGALKLGLVTRSLPCDDM